MLIQPEQWVRPGEGFVRECPQFGAAALLVEKSVMRAFGFELAIAGYVTGVLDPLRLLY